MSCDTHSNQTKGLTADHLSLRPLKGIHQQLCAFHVYAQDHTRQIESHHYCTCIKPSTLFHQCIIYDSDESNARLIGIEYIVSEETFKTLPAEEKKYWHSHKFEVESGVLQLKFKEGIPETIQREVGDPVMNVLHKTYGKTIHTWAVDLHPDFPIGPPNLMMSWTGEGQGDPSLIKDRDARCGMDTESRKEHRKKYLDLGYQKDSDVDEWERTGKGIVFEAREVDVKY
ncbi:DUF1264-domain-containing protein [Ramaria rubella]|nr:DUF1264-domain-containing protein [Ramaria rubella]